MCSKSWYVWISRNSLVTYFDSFDVEHIPKRNKKLIEKKNIVNIYRIQAYDSIMYRNFCIGFIDFMLKDKNLVQYINLFSRNEYEKNNKIILRYFQKILKRLKWWKSIVFFLVNKENLKISIVCSECDKIQSKENKTSIFDRYLLITNFCVKKS